MSPITYIFDTNIISELLRNPNSSIGTRIQKHEQDRLILCECVIYEIERGLEHRNAKNQLARFQREVIPNFQVMPIQLAD